MKILFLATYFPRPLNPTIGTWALEQAMAFHDSPELEVKVVSANPWFPKWSGRLKMGVRAYSDCPRSHDWGAVQVEYVPMLYYPFGKLDAVFNRVGEPLLLLGWLSLRPRLMKIVREYEPDVVYVHHTIPNGYFALRLRQETGIPFVVTDHEMGEITACEEFPARKAVYNKVTSAAFRMVSVARVMQRDMERVFPQARCETIHNGVGRVPERRGGSVEGEEEKCLGESVGRWDGVSEVKDQRTDLRGQPKRSEDGSPRRPVVGAAGRVVVFSCGMFYGRKNFPGLIKAFNLVAEKYQHVVLRIAGDGPDRREVEAECKRSPFKDRIELMGKLDHEVVLQEMRNADVFALIGWREPFGVVYLEAMDAGLPVIACTDAGAAEIIIGAEIPDDPSAAVGLSPEKPATGVLVPPRDIAAAARALEFLILNPVLRKEIGGAARRKVQAELTWDAVVEKYIALFRAAAKDRDGVMLR